MLVECDEPVLHEPPRRRHSGTSQRYGNMPWQHLPHLWLSLSPLLSTTSHIVAVDADGTVHESFYTEEINKGDFAFLDAGAVVCVRVAGGWQCVTKLVWSCIQT